MTTDSPEAIFDSNIYDTLYLRKMSEVDYYDTTDFLSDAGLSYRNNVVRFLRSQADSNDLDLEIPPEFRSDLISTVVRDYRQNHKYETPDFDDVTFFDKLLITGGVIHWLGRDVHVKPFMAKYLPQSTSQTIRTSAVANYIFSNFGESEIADDPEKTGQTAALANSLVGKLIAFCSEEEPTGKVRYQDIFLLSDYFESTGQILLGTDEQFALDGDETEIAQTFWKLQNHESDNTRVAVDSEETKDLTIMTSTFKDGSKRIESFDSRYGIAKIKYILPTGLESNTVGSVIAGYSAMAEIPYLPDWMKDSEFVGLPYTVILDVDQNQYTITIKP